MLIYACESYYGGSHKNWLDSLQCYSNHTIKLFTMQARYWKWRMHGSAITLSEILPDTKPDLILTTDMVDVALFKTLIVKKFGQVPIIVYFHENQFGYPANLNDFEAETEKEYHFQFINISSALSADCICFNSHYHKELFFSKIPEFFNKMPDYKPEILPKLIENSCVIYPGINFSQFNNEKKAGNKHPVLLWNHRREFDKNPSDFLKILDLLNERGQIFSLILLGSGNNNSVFKTIEKKYTNQILHNGYISSYKRYIELLQEADYLPVTSFQDFFGISVMESAAAGVIPLLPRRLSYIELFGEVDSLFYATIEETVEKIVNFNSNEKQDLLNRVMKIAERFCWSKLGKEYDFLFEKVKN
jgi:glycosyltransferase involved in cell wall biosynthesis